LINDNTEEDIVHVYAIPICSRALLRETPLSLRDFKLASLGIQHIILQTIVTRVKEKERKPAADKTTYSRKQLLKMVSERDV